MSVSRQVSSSHEASFGSPEKPVDRTLTVSPEPTGHHHGPIHQVSEQTLGVDVERATAISDTRVRISMTPRRGSTLRRLTPVQRQRRRRRRRLRRTEIRNTQAPRRDEVLRTRPLSGLGLMLWAIGRMLRLVQLLVLVQLVRLLLQRII